MFNSKLKYKVTELELALKKKEEVISAYSDLNKQLESDIKTLNDIEFKYKVTKSLLEDDEAILELLEDTLLAAAKKDIAKGADIRNRKSFFYRLVNEQANKIVTMFNNGEINIE